MDDQAPHTPRRVRAYRRPTGRPGSGTAVGQVLELTVGPPGHGGRWVVRHALPGEVVRAQVTEGAHGDLFWRADAVEVLDASPDRVVAPCPFAGPGACGGCDWQHASLTAQRELKAVVLAEQLRRLAGL